MPSLEFFEEYISESMQSWSCPGVAVAIVRGDEVIHQSVHGVRDVENNLTMTADTRFAMASVTKSFTAMSAALLVDEGALSWDKPVREYIPEFILDDPYISAHLTVRDMLSHRSGLPRHDFSAWRLDLPRAEFVKRMRHLKFNASLREKFQYNNLMYCMTAYLVERIAAQRWEDFVSERIFQPLDMIASNFSPEPFRNGQIGAKGYRVERDEGGGARGLIHMPFGQHTELSPGAAGALFSTLADLIQWLKLHVNDGRVGELRLVSAGNLQQMHLPQMIVPGGGFMEALLANTIFAYGMGWFVEPYKGLTLIQHGGNVEGHSLAIGFVPQERLGIVVLTNIAMLPLPEILLREAIDRALHLSDSNWNSRFHEVFDPLINGEAAAKQTTAQERIEQAPHTHPLETYTGTYGADGYPNFSVRLADGNLQACTVGSLDWTVLRHYHYNVFEWNVPIFDLWLKVRFLVNDSGDIETVAVPLEPEVDDIIFTRKFPSLSRDISAALVGVYDTDVDGVAISITAHEDKVYACFTGDASEKVELYRADSNVIGFRFKRNRLDFTLEDGKTPRLTFKAPEITLKGTKRQ